MNVIWIVADTFRRDHLGCYGNQAIHTPSLDSLAARSVRFERHYAGDFPTMPNRADFLTGRWTGCFMRWQPLPREQLRSVLPAIASREGVHTAAIVDTPFYMRNGMNFDVGFRSFIEIPGQEYWSRGVGDDVRASWRVESDRFAPQTITRAMEWLERHYKEKFFLYIDTWDPHEPWDAPDYYSEMYWPGYDGEVINPLYSHWQDVPGFSEEKVAKAHACYCGECTMVDTWIGYFLKKLEVMGLMETTAIIFTTDHGFYFGEHDGLFGKLTRAEPSITPYWRLERRLQTWTRSPLFEEVAACPLLIYVPGVTAGVYGGLTSAVDLMPTVLDIMGHEIPEEVEGRSLLPAARDPGTRGREFVITTHPFANPGVIIRSVDGQERQTVGSDTTVTTDEWSLLYFPEQGESSLYHLPSDPRQDRDVIRERPEAARELHRMLVRFMDEHKLAPELRDPRLELQL